MSNFWEAVFTKISAILSGLTLLFAGATSSTTPLAIIPNSNLSAITTEITVVAPKIDPEQKTSEPKDSDLATKTKPEPEKAMSGDLPIKSTDPVKNSALAKSATSTVAALVATTTNRYDLGTINKLNQNTAINILCNSEQGGYFKPLSGTGVIINSRGVILTVAHVAEYFLLKDYPNQDSIICVGRLGNPARTVYKLEPVFISPKWIIEHKKAIINDQATETGESDFALLRIVGSFNTRDYPMDKPFPFIAPEFDEEQIDTGKQVLIAGFPAGFTGGITVALSLYRTATVAEIGELFSFNKESHIDLFSLGGNIAAQKGVSGGAIISNRNKLLGVAVTSTDAKNTADRNLRALSIPHIARLFKEQSGESLEQALNAENQGVLFKVAHQFNEYTAPNLTKVLTDVIEKKD